VTLPLPSSCPPNYFHDIEFNHEKEERKKKGRRNKSVILNCAKIAFPGRRGREPCRKFGGHEDGSGNVTDHFSQIKGKSTNPSVPLLLDLFGSWRTDWKVGRRPPHLAISGRWGT
jgi:hypothetical protein